MSPAGFLNRILGAFTQVWVSLGEFRPPVGADVRFSGRWDLACVKSQSSGTEQLGAVNVVTGASGFPLREDVSLAHTLF